MLFAYIIEHEEQGLLLVVNRLTGQATVVEILRPQNLIAGYLPSDRRGARFPTANLTDGGLEAVTRPFWYYAQYARRQWKRGVEERRALRLAAGKDPLYLLENPWFPRA